MKRVQSLALIGAALLFLGACSSGYKEGAKTSESVMTAAQEIETGRTQIDKVVASLDKLTSASPGQDLRPLFKEYSTNLDKLDSIAKAVKKRAEEMRAKGAAYFKEWDAQVATINNEDIKTQSAERRTQVEAAFRRISEKSQTLKDAYQPMMSNLQDIRTALNNDLTPTGVSGIRPIANQIASQAIAVKNAAGEVAAEFKALGVKMSPSGS